MLGGYNLRLEAYAIVVAEEVTTPIRSKRYAIRGLGGVNPRGNNFNNDLWEEK